MLGLVIAIIIIGWVVSAFFALRKHENLPIKITAEMVVNGIAIILLMLTLWFAVLAYKNKEQLFGNLATSVGSIAVTVILIDRLNAWRIFEQRKQEIFEQVQSPVRDVAVEALRLACKYGWLYQLKYEDKLKGGRFQGADLRGVDLEYANLQAVDLREADLTGAKLVGANLLYASLKGAVFSRDTTYSPHFNPEEVGVIFIEDIWWEKR